MATTNFNPDSPAVEERARRRDVQRKANRLFRLDSKLEDTSQPNKKRLPVSHQVAKKIATVPERMEAKAQVTSIPLSMTRSRIQLNHSPAAEESSEWSLEGSLHALMKEVGRRGLLDELEV